MKTQKDIQYFVRFLKDNDSYLSYVKYVTNQKFWDVSYAKEHGRLSRQDYGTVNDFFSHAPKYAWLCGAFYWSCTFENFDYWELLSARWGKIWRHKNK